MVKNLIAFFIDRQKTPEIRASRLEYPLKSIIFNTIITTRLRFPLKEIL